MTHYFHLFLAIALGLSAIIWMVLQAERKERAEAARLGADHLLVQNGNSKNITPLK